MMDAGGADQGWADFAPQGAVPPSPSGQVRSLMVVLCPGPHSSN